MIDDIALHLSLYLVLKLMKKLLITFLLLGSIIPSVEAGVSPEGIRRRGPRCRVDGAVVVGRMPRTPRPRKCTIRRPCVPRDYYRPMPPRRIPMPLR